MATMNEHEENMTLFFSKRTGEIKNHCGGVQDMGFFADDKEDMKQIYDYVVKPYDLDVILNSDRYIIADDPKTGEKEIFEKPTQRKYRSYRGVI